MFGSKNKLGDGQYIFIPKKFLAETCTKLNEKYIKVYVYARFLACEGDGYASGQTLINDLDMPGEEVSEAVKALADMGYITLMDGGMIAFPESWISESVGLEQKPRYLSGEVATYIMQDSDLSDLIDAAQLILGKVLSTHGINTIYGLYDWLGMSPDVILKVLEYCVEMGKKNYSYIESVAIEWQKNGILTVDDADAYIENEIRKKTYVYRAKKIFGINNRNFTSREEEYVKNWELMGINSELLNYAFEYCVERTGKLAIPYMDKVLISWKNAGITTAAEAEESVKNHAEAARSEAEGRNGAKPIRKPQNTSVFNGNKYDADEIERIARRKVRENLKEES